MAVITHSDQERRLEWFRDARFGMFIHWGLYALLGRHEWVMNRERIPVDEYEELAGQWKPRAGFARDWAKLAKQAGMKYMVLTTKHHEGFCLFDSELTDYKATNHGPGRDLVAEYVEACRAEGLKVGFYFSLLDWHHPDGARCAKDAGAERRFIEYVHGQVEELCTKYGKIDIMWFDGNWPLSVDSWMGDKIIANILSLQPDCIVNNRTGQDADFGTPEQRIVAEEGGRMWEACMTFNGSWGYTPIDKTYKSAWEVVSMLRQCAAGGGNLLLNVGPTPEGDIPYPCDAELAEVGKWMEKYGASVYEATDPMRQDWMITGAFTRRGSTLYYHCNRWPGSELGIGGLRCKVVGARLMGGPAIEFVQKADRLLLKGLPKDPPDELATVIELETEGEPAHVLEAGHVLLSEVE